MPRSSPVLRPGARARFLPPVDPPTAPPAVVPHYDDPESVTPDPTPASATKVHYTDAFRQNAITLDHVTIEDCDQLWDWVRTDKEGTAEFLGATFANSRALFDYIAKVAQHERDGTAALYAIREGDLIGFAMLWPIQRETGKAPIATAHLYVAPDARGRIKQLLGVLIGEADRLRYNLSVITQRQEWATALAESGFATHFLLTRQVSKQVEA